MAKPKTHIPHLPTKYDPVRDRRVPYVDVWVAEEKFGKIALMSDSILNPSKNRDQFDQALEQVADAAANVKAEDWIMAVGDVLLVAAAIAYAIDQNGSARVLRWDKEKRSYYEVEMTL